MRIGHGFPLGILCFAATTLAFASTGGETAARAPWLTEEPYEIRQDDSGLKPVVRVADRIEAQLAKLAGGGADVGFGRDETRFGSGESGQPIPAMLVSAITPVRGEFAVIPLDQFKKASGTVRVCWFELVWPTPGAFRSAAGMGWALRRAPTRDCRALQPDKTNWEQASAAVQRTVTLRRGNASIVSLLNDSEATNPVDLRAALWLALRPGEKLIRITPVPSLYKQQAFAWTSTGRTLLAMPERDGPFDVCVIEAPRWAELMKRNSLVGLELERTCYPLFQEVGVARSQRLDAEFRKHPPTTSPVPTPAFAASIGRFSARTAAPDRRTPSFRLRCRWDRGKTSSLVHRVRP
ncbi:MAG: hypothetical protein ACKOQM_05160 [Novosphingobium sp.]